MDARLCAPAAERNREPILGVLRAVLPRTGRVLEVASGTGQHAAYFAAHLPGLELQPSDPDPVHRRSIEAWQRHAGLPNLRGPIALDTTESDWETNPAIRGLWQALICINLLHIAPWSAALGLLRGAAPLVEEEGPLFLYGPYRRADRATAASNEAFDAELRRQDPAWGIRALEDVVEAGARHGWRLDSVVEMPAHNLSVVLRRGGGS